MRLCNFVESGIIICRALFFQVILGSLLLLSYSVYCLRCAKKPNGWREFGVACTIGLAYGLLSLLLVQFVLYRQESVDFSWVLVFEHETASRYIRHAHSYSKILLTKVVVDLD